MKCLYKGGFGLLIVAVGTLFQPSSAQTPSAGTHKPAATPGTSALEMALASGQIVYDQHCAVCHQADGTGVPFLNPPLSQNDHVGGDKKRIILTVLQGLDTHEPINDEVYSNVMPAHDFLTDQQISDVLTFVRNSFNNKASPVSVAEVATVRANKQ